MLADFPSFDHDRANLHVDPMTTIIFEVNGSDRLVLPQDSARTETDILRLAQEEAERCEVPLSDVTIRFVVEAEASNQVATQKHFREHPAL